MGLLDRRAKRAELLYFFADKRKVNLFTFHHMAFFQLIHCMVLSNGLSKTERKRASFARSLARAGLMYFYFEEIKRSSLGSFLTLGWFNAIVQLNYPIPYS